MAGEVYRVAKVCNTARRHIGVCLGASKGGEIHRKVSSASSTIKHPHNTACNCMSSDFNLAFFYSVSGQRSKLNIL